MSFHIFAPYLKLIHVAAAFFLLGGMIGREVVNRRAKQASDLKIVAEMLGLSQFFTMKIVAPSGQLVLWIGILTAVTQGWPLFGFLQGGSTNWVLASLLLNIGIIINVIVNMRPTGEAIGQALGAALPGGQVTPELSAAINSPRMNNAYLLEYGLVTIIIILMVLKPL